MSPLTSWRLPLRLARRDALRHRARSLLVLVMIALPVLAVTAADVMLQTQSVSGRESVDRRMGSAQALVSVSDGVSKVQQPPDPNDCCAQTDGTGKESAPGAEQLSSLLDGATLVELRRGEVQFRTAKGLAPIEAIEVDLTDPLTDGLTHLTSGRLPRSPGEVVVNQAVLDHGYRVGDRLDLTAADSPSAPTIVGVAESTTVRTFPFAAGPLGSLGIDTAGGTSWLVDGGPVSWTTVRQLNAIGATVASRTVIDHPPPVSEWPPDVRPTSTDSTSVAVVGLIAIMALIEVVLLAGPAFAVTARRQQRTLALMASAGGTPSQSRRVIVASAVVLGGAAAVAGVVLGIGAARLAEPLLQRRSDQWFGPLDVPWLHLVGVAGFGLLSAFLAALVPAYLASRQDVVAVLAGRRGDRAPSLRSPILGLVLLALGILGSAVGAQGSSASNTSMFLIAASSIPAVLGMVLLVPVVLAGVARLSGRLPLVLRYAVRDANRHRTRTAPAVAAVAATVAGVVALGIGLTSDQKENLETYHPSVAHGVAIVSAPDPTVSWAALRGVLDRELPDAKVTEEQGLSDENAYTEVRSPGGDVPLVDTSGGALGANVMVSDDAVPVGMLGMAKKDYPRAEEELRSGGVVAFVRAGSKVTDDPRTTVVVIQHRFDPVTGKDLGSLRARLPALLVPLTGAWAGPAALMSTQALAQLGTQPVTVALAVTGGVDRKQQDAVNQGLASINQSASMYVERGYQADDATVIAQLVLILLGAVLMLGGTLTATFLALSDARPDLATLSAVGASPRTRRGVAAAYAVVVGGVGALLGAAVGFIPGLAVTRPLTYTNYSDGPSGPFLDVPWLMVVALVVVLPVVTALVVGLFARSRLPLVARLD